MKNTHSLTAASVLLAGLAGFGSIAQAQIQWSAGDTNGDFTVGANWDGGTAPVSGNSDTARIGDGNNGYSAASATYNTSAAMNLSRLEVGFAGTTTGTFTISDGTVQAITTLGQFNAASGNINVNGGTLDLLNGSSIGGSSATSTLTLGGGTLSASSNSFFQVSNNAHIVFNSGTVTGGNNKIRTVQCWIRSKYGFHDQWLGLDNWLG